MNPTTIARESYRLWRDRGIAPDEVFGEVLRAEGYGDSYSTPRYRAAYRKLADAWTAHLAEARLDGRACSYCGALLPAGAKWLCDGDTCRLMKRAWFGTLDAAKAA